MIVYITFAQRDEQPNWAQAYARHAQRFEECGGGWPCLLLPYYHASRELLVRLNPYAVVFSGFARSWCAYPARDLLEVGRILTDLPRLPMLALCGSHQLVGFVFNGELTEDADLQDQPMRRLRPGEPVNNPDYHPEYLMERGFYPLQVQEPDPLFADCGNPPMVYESHYCEVKKVPPDFRLLASTAECRIQAMRHRDRLLYSLQFHPEDYTDAFPDGKSILSQFFSMARSVAG